MNGIKIKEKESNFTVGSLFAGIGGIDKAFSNSNFNISWAIEFNKYACDVYRYNHNNFLIEEDIYKIDSSSFFYVDVLVAGFSCQPFSIAGKQNGFNDSRGNDFYKIMSIVDYINPKVLFLENVPNLKRHNKGKTFEKVLTEIKSREYYVKYAVLNTSEYTAIPQNRSRLFIVAFKNKKEFDNFSFPERVKFVFPIDKYIHSSKQKSKYYYTDTQYDDMLKSNVLNKNTIYQIRRTYVRENKNNLCPTLTANMGTGGHNVPIVLTENGIRKLTPRECFSFQGYQDIIIPDHISDSQLYKQAGNSVTIPLIYRIAKNIKRALDHE